MKKIISSLRLKLYIIYSLIFCKVVRDQIKNNFIIPIIIINYNQFESFKKLVNTLLERGFKNIIILDNNSTYNPLLNYYLELDNNPNITLHLLEKNLGHMALWKRKDILKLYSKGYFVVTDPDISIGKDVPDDFIKLFIKLINSNVSIKKVGFSLVINDIPDYYVNKEKVISWEKKFWRKKMSSGHYLAKIDTTFALYRPLFIYDSHNFEEAIRTNNPYSVRPLGWYIDYNNLTEEQIYYIKTANNSSSWLLNRDNKLLSNRARKHYE